MRQSRDTSPMPANINSLRNSLPTNGVLYLNRSGGNIPFMRRFFNGVKWAGKKLLVGGGTLGGLYGAYKLGQHKDAILNKFNKVKEGIYSAFSDANNNLTRSHE